MKIFSKILSVMLLFQLSVAHTSDGGSGSGDDEPAEAETPSASEEENNFNQIVSTLGSQNISRADSCTQLMAAYSSIQPPPAQVPAEIVTCQDLQHLSGGAGAQIRSFGNDMESEVSLDGAIVCRKPASYTIDFEGCKNAVKYYNAVFLADKAMGMQQAVRTNLKGQSVNQQTQQRMAQGDSQGAAFDGATELQEHGRNINREKVLTYVSAVGALTAAWRAIPGENKALYDCTGDNRPQNDCANSINIRDVRANKDAVGAIQVAMAGYAAKAFAAQMALKRNEQAIATINKARQPFEELGSDLMLERCQFNPADPACQTAGNRVKGQTFRPGDFNVGGPGTNNSFNMNPEEGTFGEVGAETDLGGGTTEIADMNNPFAEDARVASDILNPAGAADVQAQGGAGGGGGGVGGGGLGGGGASLGSDLSGENKDSNQDPKIKTGKVSGAYAAAGGGGYKGIARGKEDKNPFADLLKDKGPSGGVVEDRSIASGDIDGKASGLFQKISKRYNQIHADKRIQANNLE